MAATARSGTSRAKFVAFSKAPYPAAPSLCKLRLPGLPGRVPLRSGRKGNEMVWKWQDLEPHDRNHHRHRCAPSCSPKRGTLLGRFPVLEMFYWKRIIFDEATRGQTMVQPTDFRECMMRVPACLR